MLGARGVAGADRDVAMERFSVGGSDPVIVLTYPHAGGARLQALLSRHPALACTAETGLLVACEQAAAAWRRADGRPGRPLSQLATSSVRGLAVTMMTAITVRTGKPRWCETAAPTRSAAETFLSLFPAARFVCLHRSLPGIVAATLTAHPWGLAGAMYAPYTSAHPASTVAAVTAWWADLAGPMLAFEEDHPESCLRVRYEDLTTDPGQTERDLHEFLRLDRQGPRLPEPPGNGDTGTGETDTTAGEFPVAQLPDPLRARASSLQTRLGYPPLGEPLTGLMKSAVTHAGQNSGGGDA